MIRLFTALLIPDEIKHKIYTACLSIVHNYEDYNWESQDKIHLTLKFIGEVPEDLINPIKKELSYTENYKHFNCSLSRFGFFFKDGEPKILWVGLNTDERIHKLVEELNQRLAILKVPNERRRFKPHITVLRLKKNPGEKFIKLFEEYRFEEIKFKLKTLSLIESELSHTGAIHTEIKKYNFI
jgi:RNA 2',3'-cyclic 3'-phosphodiesterase